MLSEIGISDETFAEACIKSSTNPVHKMLLSEIMAVDNFLAFKKLMVKRNRELSEEALQLMNAREAGIDPDLIYSQNNYGRSAEDDEIARAIQASLELEQNKTSPPTRSAEMDEEEMMRQVMEESKREYEMLQAARKAELEAMQESKAEEPEVKEKKKVTKPKADKEPAALKAPKTLAPLTGAADKSAIVAGFDLPKAEKKPSKETVEEPAPKKAAIEPKKPTATDMKERLEKLRQQRDILLQK